MYTGKPLIALTRRDLHQKVTLRCSACGDEWMRDQWLGIGGLVDEDMEEVQHALSGCNGQVAIVNVHRHDERCGCVIPMREDPPFATAARIPAPNPANFREPIRK